MRRILILVTVLGIAGIAPLGAQRAPGPPQPVFVVDGVVLQDRMQPQGPQPDPFARFLFPPELVMQHQGDIGLTDAQRASLMTAIQQAQSKVTETQFKLSAEGEKLGRVLQSPAVDESQALEQVDRILALEREMKRAQVGLLVRIKNVLTPAQQTRLNQLRQGRE